MNNYEKLEEKYIEDIDSKATVYRHIKTKARIVTLENDDDNKVFSIGFRTPPKDSTGLTHILEHSVLCGSRKYPVKDPFVELLKSSLNTFLNAFTFPDKTMYPVASKNLKDFNNLMDVYLDAVFYPNIYNHKEIFMQEGWRYHIMDKKDPIIYNGVVYNEMKGAFSNPQSVLSRVIMHTLYKDMAYGLESGGDPKYIPDLTYESFLNFHKKYYHPSNSYIFIYGNCNMEDELELIDKNYLSNFSYDDFDTTIQIQKPFNKPVLETYYYESDEVKEKTFLSYNVAFPHDIDLKAIIATNILLTSLFEESGAKITERLIKEEVGQNIEAYLDDGLLMPMLSIMAINSEAEKEDKFINIINEELQEVVKKGVDKNAILSLIKFGEFKARESLISPRFPKGLNIIVNAMSSYLYDDNKALDRLEVIKYFKELKTDLENGYFEEIINKYILNNNHKAYVKLVPKPNYLAEERKLVEDRLKKYKDSLSDKELEELIEANVNLKKYQEEPSSLEDVNKLPKLSIEDINKDPEKLNLEVINNSNYDILYSNYHTNDIYYVNHYFDISNIDINILKYVSLFNDLSFEFDTNKYTYKELNELIKAETGGVGISLNTYKKVNGDTLIKINTGFSCLKDNIALAYDLLTEAMLNVSFSNKKRLLEKLKELKSNLDMSVVNRGHAVAIKRALSQIDKSSYEDENIGGIEYSIFITSLINDFDNKSDEIVSNLENVKKLFSKNNVIMSLTGNDNMLNVIKPYYDSFYNLLADNINYPKYIFKETRNNEGFRASFDVNYNSLVAKHNMKYNGGFAVLSNILNNDYLYQMVRIKGGAYGVFLRISDDGLGFTSYRDPNIKNTYEVYKNIANYISNIDISLDELLKYKIGTIGNTQLVLHNKDLAEMARTNYFKDLTYEIRKQRRQEILDVTIDDIKGFNKLFSDALKDYVICTIGNKDKVEEEKALFTKIEKLEK